MKNYLIFIALSTFIGIHAQQPLTNTNCDITLTIQGEDGTNGVAVAYNADKQLYYSVFAGNSLFPLETHSIAGTSVATQEAGFDVRGMWYNPGKKCLEGICYDNGGGYEITLDANGQITGSRATAFSYGMGSQTVAVYAEKKKSVMFVEESTVYFFKLGKMKSKTVSLEIPSGVTLNTNGPIYTGVKNYEIGLLEAETMTVHLFSASTGKETGTVKLNAGNCTEVTEVPDYFRVSYCNDRVFLFDTYTRTWTGYKLF